METSSFREVIKIEANSYKSIPIFKYYTALISWSGGALFLYANIFDFENQNAELHKNTSAPSSIKKIEHISMTLRRRHMDLLAV